MIKTSPCRHLTPNNLLIIKVNQLKKEAFAKFWVSFNFYVPIMFRWIIFQNIWCIDNQKGIFAQCFHFLPGYLIFMKHKSTQILIIKKAIDIANTITLLSLNCKHYFFLVLATVAFAFLLLPMCQYLIRPCSTGQK